MIGVRDPSEYEFPYVANKKMQFSYSHPPDDNPKDLTTNMVGVATPEVSIQNAVCAPRNSTYLADFAHEFDYESEDLEFQPESFKFQHFRKQGPLWMWIIMCSSPLWFLFNEFYGQTWPNAYIWRYQRPPPFDYPDDMETPDSVNYPVLKSKEYRQLYDSGLVVAPYY
jgi:hypothetical protein